MASHLAPGAAAPKFDLPSTNGANIKLTDLKGKKVVFYFYPRDSTPGCTTEACDFRDNLNRLQKSGAVVLGVSKDSIDSHNKFREKQNLTFDLLSDKDNEVAKAYGAYGEKVMYGKKILGTIRSTFLIDEKGVLLAVWSPVKVTGHVDAVLAALAGDAKPKRK